MSHVCPMCLKTVPKLKSDSHVLPRFFLRPIRDPKNGQIRVIDVFKSVIDGKTQDLPKGTYICPDCETLTAKLDGYGAKVLNSPSTVPISIAPVVFGKIQFERWQGIDFQKFRDFLISILVRDHCWRRSEGLVGLMSDAEYENMRNFLMSSPANDDNSFPIVIHKIRSVPGIHNLNRVTSPPVQSVPGDAVTFMGLGYGFMVYFKAPVTQGMNHFVNIFRLKSDGSINMVLAHLGNIGTWSRSEKAIADSYRKMEERKRS